MWIGMLVVDVVVDVVVVDVVVVDVNGNGDGQQWGSRGWGPWWFQAKGVQCG
jgi:hypothetical protein